jgi:putative FmdB family regulatory protein
MPIYEYVCQQCGKVTEALRRMQEADAAIACEHCGSEQTCRDHSVFAAGSDTGSAGAELPIGGGCACGDPNGPCAM